jgi:hypothetical protein
MCFTALLKVDMKLNNDAVSIAVLFIVKWYERVVTFGEFERTEKENVVVYYKLLSLRSQEARWLSGVALGYGLDDRGFETGKGARNFCLLHRVQTGSGAHPTSYPMSNRVSFPGGKAAGAWSWLLTSI